MESYMTNLVFHRACIIGTIYEFWEKLWLNQIEGLESNIQHYHKEDNKQSPH